METIYADMAARTGGSIYMGVVGPVRTGKSTLVKKIMETLVIPGIRDPYRAQRARDELPQCGSGRTIMTSEPKFVPEEAVEIFPDGKTGLRVRLIDSVGYMIDGAQGVTEEGEPRMVTTPWADQEIPMAEAAELGTRKVMEDHASLGLVVTTDGSITEIPRQDYVEAERKSIRDMQGTGKPFLVIVNSSDPQGQQAQAVQDSLRQELGVEAVCLDCQSLDTEQIQEVFRLLLLRFPLQQVRVYLPRWMDALEQAHPVKAALFEALLGCTGKLCSLGDAAQALAPLGQLEQVTELDVRPPDAATGTVSCVIAFPEALYYEILSTRAGIPIADDSELLHTLAELSEAKKAYDKISEALASAMATGYGVVMPTAQEMTLKTPEVVKKGSSYGVRLRAGAPSIHLIRVDIDTEISPMVGNEQQSKDLISFLSGEDPDALWHSNLFGKSVYDMIQEGLGSKVLGLPQEVRDKFRATLGRIVNEGASGLITLIL